MLDLSRHPLTFRSVCVRSTRSAVALAGAVIVLALLLGGTALAVPSRAATRACQAPDVGAAPTASKPWFGVHATLRDQAPAVRSRRARASCLLGVSILREDLEWRIVQPEEDGPMSFVRFDRVVLSAATRGLTVLPILDGVPSWAGPRRQGAPTRPAAYAKFAAAAVRRYGPEGSFWGGHPGLPRRPARWWEHMNEVYLHDANARRYAVAVVAATAAMRAADSGVRVLVGADSYWRVRGRDQADWLGQLYDADSAFGVSYDAVSVHPYSWPAGPTPTGPPNRRTGTGRLEGIRATLVRRGAAAKHLWVTEIGWPTCRRNPRCVSPTAQARDLQGFVRLRDTRWSQYVDAVILYQLQDEDSRSRDPEDGFGILDDRGRSKPARTVWARLAGAATRKAARQDR